MSHHQDEDDEEDDDWRAIDSGSSDEEDDANERRKRRKHEDTYGVFWEEEDNDRRKKRQFRRDGSKPAGEPKFVRGIKPDTTEAETTTTTTNNLRSPAGEEKPFNNTPSDDEMDAEEMQKKAKANEHFLALLAKGRDKKARQKTEAKRGVESAQRPQQSASLHDRPSAVQHERTLGLGFQSHDRKETSPFESAAGLGFKKRLRDESSVADNKKQGGLGFSSRQGIGMKVLPTAFGKQSFEPKETRPDPNIGKWEKHEKGIGSKLLAKMGYKGSGGLRSDSIAAPIKVKLRPANLGLGFGNFKEVASKPKPKPQLADEMESSASIGQTSALPTANDILKQTKRRNKKSQKLTFVSYHEILKKAKESTGSMHIIDMTGGTLDKEKSREGEVALADELLYNVSFVLNTYENRLQSASTFEQSYRRQQSSFEENLGSLRNQASILQEREAKLLQVQKLLEGAEKALSSGSFSSSMRETQAVIEEISSLFSVEEVKDWRLFETLVPALFGTVVEKELHLWTPTSPLPSETTVRLLLLHNKDDDMWDLARKALLTDHIIPHLKRRFFSSRWDPMDDSHIGLELVDLFRSVLKESATGKEESTATGGLESVLDVDNPAERTDLFKVFQELLVDGPISEKLTATIQCWKPGEGKRIDLWVLPWLPFLSKGFVPTLVAECKRHLKADISFLNKTVSDNSRFVDKALASLRPWTGVLKPRSLQSVTRETVTPRLARLLAKHPFSPNSDDEKLIDLPLELHACELIDDRTLLSLIEGELLPNMAKSSLAWSRGEKARKYCSWKLLVFRPKVQSILKMDDGVCRGFYAILLSEQFLPSNYHAVFARRKLQAKEKNDEEWIRQEDKTETVEARVKLAGQTATFREVVEEFARSHDLLFIPHRSKRVDGKQVFHFGKIPVYLDGNVAYSSIKAGDWEATSLQEIANAATLLGD